MLLSATYNSDAPRDMFVGLQEKLPAILSTATQFAEKYGILDVVKTLKNNILNFLNEAYATASSHAPELSQLSALYQNVVVQSQKITQSFLDDVIKFLRETRFVLPGMSEATLPEICSKIYSDVGEVLKKFMIVFNEYLEQYFFPIFESINTVQLSLPSGDVITMKDIQDSVREILRSISTEIPRMVQELDSPDVYLEKVGKAYEELVKMAQEVVDKIDYENLEGMAASLNTYYTAAISVIKEQVDNLKSTGVYEQINAVFEQYVMTFFETILKFLTDVTSFLSTQAETMVKVSDGKLEIEFPYPFVQ